MKVKKKKKRKALNPPSSRVRSSLWRFVPLAMCMTVPMHVPLASGSALQIQYEMKFQSVSKCNLDPSL
jgi:hypothetical protein